MNALHYSTNFGVYNNKTVQVIFLCADLHFFLFIIIILTLSNVIVTSNMKKWSRKAKIKAKLH